VSTEAQAEEGESLGVRQRQLEGWAQMKGLALDAVYIERGISGSVPVAERPQGSKLCAKLERGDTVIAPKLKQLPLTWRVGTLDRDGGCLSLEVLR
jgi:putative DNA-invertase from lambdoid prophage Rac